VAAQIRKKRKIKVYTMRLNIKIGNKKNDICGRYYPMMGIIDLYLNNIYETAESNYKGLCSFLKRSNLSIDDFFVFMFDYIAKHEVLHFLLEKFGVNRKCDTSIPYLSFENYSSIKVEHTFIAKVEKIMVKDYFTNKCPLFLKYKTFYINRNGYLRARWRPGGAKKFMEEYC